MSVCSSDIQLIRAPPVEGSSGSDEKKREEFARMSPNASLLPYALLCKVLPYSFIVFEKFVRRKELSRSVKIIILRTCTEPRRLTHFKNLQDSLYIDEKFQAYCSERLHFLL